MPSTVCAQTWTQIEIRARQHLPLRVVESLSVELVGDAVRGWGAVEVKALESQPLPLPIVLPPLTAVQAGQQVAPAGAKIQQLGLPSWNLDRCSCHPTLPLP